MRGKEKEKEPNHKQEASTTEKPKLTTKELAKKLKPAKKKVAEKPKPTSKPQKKLAKKPIFNFHFRLSRFGRTL